MGDKFHSNQHQEVLVGVNIPKSSDLRVYYDMELTKFALNGPKMKDVDVKMAIAEIGNFFSKRAEKLISSAMLSKEPMLIRYLQTGLFYSLFNAIKSNRKVNSGLKKEVFMKSKEPVGGKRSELVKKLPVI